MKRRTVVASLALLALGATLGIIDSTDYLDENAYANDEYTQFMNEVFVNSLQALLPSYDAGGALEWRSSHWYARGVGMNVGKNDNEYNFFGATLAGKLNSSWGKGNYRLMVVGAVPPCCTASTCFQSVSEYFVCCFALVDQCFSIFGLASLLTLKPQVSRQYQEKGKPLRSTAPSP